MPWVGMGWVNRSGPELFALSWVSQVLEQLPEKIVERLVSRLNVAENLITEPMIIGLLVESNMDDLATRLRSSMPDDLLKSPVKASKKLRTRHALYGKELILATAKAVERIVTKLEGDE